MSLRHSPRVPAGIDSGHLEHAPPCESAYFCSFPFFTPSLPCRMLWIHLIDKLIAFMFLPCGLLLNKPKFRQLNKQLPSNLPETIMLGKKSLVEKEAFFSVVLISLPRYTQPENSVHLPV